VNLEFLLTVNRKSIDGAEKVGKAAEYRFCRERQAVAATANHMTNIIYLRLAT